MEVGKDAQSAPEKIVTGSKPESLVDSKSDAERTVLVSDSLQKGVVALTEAIQLDGQGNVTGALAGYEKAIFYLELALKAESDITKSALIMQKLSEYNGRIEILKASEKKKNPQAVIENDDIDFDQLHDEFLDFGEDLEGLVPTQPGSDIDTSLEERLSMLSSPSRTQPESPPQTNAKKNTSDPMGFTIPPSFTSSSSSSAITSTPALVASTSASNMTFYLPTSQSAFNSSAQKLPYGHPGSLTPQFVLAGAPQAATPPPVIRPQSSSSSSLAVASPALRTSGGTTAPTNATTTTKDEITSSSSSSSSSSSAVVAPQEGQSVMNLVQGAATLINEARVHERNGQMARSLQLYHSGIAQIMQAIQLEADPALKQVLRTKTHLLLTHAEDLKASQGPKVTFSSVTTKSVEIAESLAKKAREFYDKASIEQSAEFYELAVRELRAALEREEAVEVKKWLSERLYIMEMALKGANAMMRFVKFVVPYPYSLVFTVSGAAIKKSGIVDKAQKEIEDVLNPKKRNTIDDLFADPPSSKDKKGKKKK